MALYGIRRAKAKVTYKVKKVAKDIVREAPAKYYVQRTPARDPQLIKAYQALRYHWGIFPFSNAQAIRTIAKDLQVSGTVATSLFKKLKRQGCLRATRTTWPV